MIGRISSEQAVRNFLGDLEGNYRSLSESQRQVSTGKRILTPSDDPVGVAIGLGLRRDQSAASAWNRNIDDSLTWLDTTDGALGQALEIVQRARELAVQGGNGTLSAASAPAHRQRGRRPARPVRRGGQQQPRGALHLRRHGHRHPALRPRDAGRHDSGQHEPAEPRGRARLGREREHHRRPPPGPARGDRGHLHGHHEPVDGAPDQRQRGHQRRPERARRPPGQHQRAAAARARPRSTASSSPRAASRRRRSPPATSSRASRTWTWRRPSRTSPCASRSTRRPSPPGRGSSSRRWSISCDDPATAHPSSLTGRIR